MGCWSIHIQSTRRSQPVCVRACRITDCRITDGLPVTVRAARTVTSSTQWSPQASGRLSEDGNWITDCRVP
eukprot:4650066-Alexandrium_andersonii.AAC.1